MLVGLRLHLATKLFLVLVALVVRVVDLGIQEEQLSLELLPL